MKGTSCLIWGLAAGMTLIPTPVGDGQVAFLADQARTEIHGLSDIIWLFAARKGEYPESLEAVTQDGFLKNHARTEVPLDPWGRPYRYERNSEAEGGGVVWSQGPDEGDDTDDIRSDASRCRVTRW